jgi:hypothetical protein
MAALTTRRSRQCLHLVEHRAGHPLYDELSYPVPPLKADRMVRIGVQQYYLDLATVPGVHCARRIDNGDAVTGRQAGTRMHEGGIPIGERDSYPGTNDRSLTGTKLDVRCQVQVAASVTGVSGGGQRQSLIEPLDQDLHPVLLAVHGWHISRPAERARQHHASTATRR